jgi:peptidoglycan/xylan/chitin deacetylase (PgdA/CDA1 family)
LKSSILIKSILALCLHSMGLVQRRLRILGKSQFAILMYHRVLPEKEIEKWLQPGMYVLTDTFKNHIEFLKHHFSIVPLSDLLIQRPKKFRSPDQKPFSALTFDDGWYDFYASAFPVLVAEHVPATVFLPTDFIGTERWFWTDRLGFLLSCLGEVPENETLPARVTNYHVRALQNLRGPFESRLEAAIRYLKTYPLGDIEETLEELSSLKRVESSLGGRAFLSWKEVREMKVSGLITYGSHTGSHRILTTLSESEVDHELKRSREKLLQEEVADPAFMPFSYPNGNFNESIAQSAQKMGYYLAVTTEGGWNTIQSSLYSLNRIPVHQDIAFSHSMFGCRLIGML